LQDALQAIFSRELLFLDVNIPVEGGGAKPRELQQVL
jgi:hypothetical protein